MKTETYIVPPRTTMDVFKMLPEGTRCELINSIIYITPAPLVNHQSIVGTLAGLFYAYVKKKKAGNFFISPIDVFLDRNKNAFQPDLVFVSNKNLSIIKENGIYGSPDLVIEVLSPGTQVFDLTKKKKVYEKSGVKEYWIVDPFTMQCTCFILINQKFVEHSNQKGRLISPLLKHTFIL